MRQKARRRGGAFHENGEHLSLRVHLEAQEGMPRVGGGEGVVVELDHGLVGWGLLPRSHHLFPLSMQLICHTSGGGALLVQICIGALLLQPEGV